MEEIPNDGGPKGHSRSKMLTQGVYLGLGKREVQSLN